MGKRLLLTCAAVLTFSASANAAELIVNGDFSSGLAGWTSYNTVNGTISPSNPYTTDPAETGAFGNVSGASSALWLNAGQASGFGLANPQGGGVSQSFTLASAGTAIFSADLASWTSLLPANTFTNGDPGGLFSVLIDGVVAGSYDFGPLPKGTSYHSLSFATGLLAAGDHMIALQVVRPFAPAKGIRSQYWDNVSLDFTAAAVPEPATWGMMIAGFAAIGAAARRRRALVSFG